MLYPPAAGGLCFAQSGAGAGGSCAERDVSLPTAVPPSAAPCPSAIAITSALPGKLLSELISLIFSAVNSKSLLTLIVFHELHKGEVTHAVILADLSGCQPLARGGGEQRGTRSWLCPGQEVWKKLHASLSLACHKLVTSRRHLTTICVGASVGPGLNFFMPQLSVGKVEMKVSPHLTWRGLAVSTLALLREPNGTCVYP